MDDNDLWFGGRIELIIREELGIESNVATTWKVISKVVLKKFSRLRNNAIALLKKKMESTSLIFFVLYCQKYKPN